MSAYFVRHTDAGGWTNFYGPFRSMKTARAFAKRIEKDLPESHNVSYDALEPPANFAANTRGVVVKPATLKA